MKVSIIGAGRVGVATAFSLIHSVKVDELVLIDLPEKLKELEGHAFDLTHAAYALGKDVDVLGTYVYNEANGSDVTIITAGQGVPAGVSRDEVLKVNKGIVGDIIKRFNSKSIICVTNPVDEIAEFIRERVDVPVYVLGNKLDTARLKSMGINEEVTGKHGSNKVAEKACQAVKTRKGQTEWGPAAAITAMVKEVSE